MNIHEEMNQLADALVGYREATFEQMMKTVETLKASDAILRTSQNAVARRKDVKEACDQLMAEIESLSEEI